jgi:hypothetical protein
VGGWGELPFGLGSQGCPPRMPFHLQEAELHQGRDAVSCESHFLPASVFPRAEWVLAVKAPLSCEGEMNTGAVGPACLKTLCRGA